MNDLVDKDVKDFDLIGFDSASALIGLNEHGEVKRVIPSGIPIEKIWYCVDNQSGSSGPRTAIIPGFVKEVGTLVVVLFEAGVLTLNPTFEVNDTGASPIQHKGSQPQSSSIPPNLAATAKIPPRHRALLIYDGHAWQLLNPSEGEIVSNAIAPVSTIHTIQSSRALVTPYAVTVSFNMRMGGSVGRNNVFARVVNLPLPRIETACDFALRNNSTASYPKFVTLDTAGDFYFRNDGLNNNDILSVSVTYLL